MDQSAHVAQHPLLGVLPDGAGVDDDDPGLLLVGGKAEAHLGQIPSDALGVGLVLLAAVGVHKGQGLGRPLGGDGGDFLAEVQLPLHVGGGDGGGGSFHGEKPSLSGCSGAPWGREGPVWAAPGGDCLKNNSISVFPKKLKGSPPPLAPFWTDISLRPRGGP